MSGMSDDDWRRFEPWRMPIEARRAIDGLVHWFRVLESGMKDREPAEARERLQGVSAAADRLIEFSEGVARRRGPGLGFPRLGAQSPHLRAYGSARFCPPAGRHGRASGRPETLACPRRRAPEAEILGRLRGQPPLASRTARRRLPLVHGAMARQLDEGQADAARLRRRGHEARGPTIGDGSIEEAIREAQKARKEQQGPTFRPPPWPWPEA